MTNLSLVAIRRESEVIENPLPLHKKKCQTLTLSLSRLPVKAIHRIKRVSGTSATIEEIAQTLTNAANAVTSVLRDDVASRRCVTMTTVTIRH